MEAGKVKHPHKTKIRKNFKYYLLAWDNSQIVAETQSSKVGKKILTRKLNPDPQTCSLY